MTAPMRSGVTRNAFFSGFCSMTHHSTPAFTFNASCGTIPTMSTTAKAEPQPSPFQKFQQFAKKVLSVPKAEIERREKEYQKQRSAKKS